MSIEQLYDLYKEYPSVQTDSRNVRNGDLFFALKGPNFNGNLFAKHALEHGAAYAIVDEDVDAKNDRIIRVDQVLPTLQQLALHHRRQFKIPFVAITGSNGKTTTKELIHAVLSASYRCYTTKGNLNNHIGVPLTILNIGLDAEIAVIEMGANHQQEIASYCVYTLPTHGLITNCGKAHLEGFGGVEGVKKGKGELYDFLRANNGTAFVMWDYDYLRDMSAGIEKIVSYGTNQADVTAIVNVAEPFLSVTVSANGPHEILTKLVGSYNLPNVLAAVAVGNHFNVPMESVVKAIEAYEPSNSRSQLVSYYSNQVILDAYNANPSSMRAAIENLAHIKSDKKVLILGAMAELGADSLEEHKAIVSLISQYEWNKVVLVGGDFHKIDHPYIQYASSEEAREWFRQQEFEDAYILIKGSRSMKMEKVLHD